LQTAAIQKVLLFGSTPRYPDQLVNVIVFHNEDADAINYPFTGVWNNAFQTVKVNGVVVVPLLDLTMVNLHLE